MKRDRRWRLQVRGSYCESCWTWWPNLGPGDVCPDGCHGHLLPDLDLAGKRVA